MGLLVTFILGLFIVIGVLVIKLFKRTKTIELLSIAIALGTMISLVLFELIPEIFETFQGSLYLPITFTIFGVIILKLLDNFIPEHDDEHSLSHNCSEENLIHIGIVSSVAIILHNIIEGMAVYNMTLESFKLGFLVSLGVGLHNIPMGMIIYSTLKNEDKKKRIILLSLVTLSTFFGGIIMLLISSLLNNFVIGILICITLGMLIYIIIFELLPHLAHSKDKILSFIGIVIGIIIILISNLLE